MTQEKRIIIEDILGDFGFRAKWSVLDYWADVEIFEIIAYAEDKAPLFEIIGATSQPGNETDDINKAEVYLEGFVKWDGCTELDMGQPHWCGPSGYKKHIDLLKYIYIRAFELMGREPMDQWVT